MSNTVTEINSLGSYHAQPYKRGHISGFQIYLVAVVALAVSALLFALLA